MSEVPNRLMEKKDLSHCINPVFFLVLKCKLLHPKYIAVIGFYVMFKSSGSPRCNVASFHKMNSGATGTSLF